MQPSLHSLHVPAQLAALRRVGAALLLLATAVRRRRQAAITRRVLSALPDRLLADVGLQSSEVHSAPTARSISPAAAESTQDRAPAAALARP